MIYDGTLPSQRTHHGTLGELVATLQRRDRRRRRSSSSARWPGCASICAGSTIVRCSASASSSRARASRRASWSRCSRSAAPRPIEAPTIRIAAARRSGRRSIARAPNAGDVRLDHLHQRQRASITSWSGCSRSATSAILKGVRLCTVGPATAARLHGYGIAHRPHAGRVPRRRRSSRRSRSSGRSRARVSCCRAPTSRASCSPTSCARPAREVDGRRRLSHLPGGTERRGEPDIYRMLLDRQIDAITFTSASAVRNFVAMLGQDQAADLLVDRRRVHRPGDRRSGAAAGHRDDGHAGALHDPDLVDALVDTSRIRSDLT